MLTRANRSSTSAASAVLSAIHAGPALDHGPSSSRRVPPRPGRMHTRGVRARPRRRVRRAARPHGTRAPRPATRSRRGRRVLEPGVTADVVTTLAMFVPLARCRRDARGGREPRWSVAGLLTRDDRPMFSLRNVVIFEKSRVFSRALHLPRRTSPTYSDGGASAGQTVELRGFPLSRGRCSRGFRPLEQACSRGRTWGCSAMGFDGGQLPSWHW